jgi:hypothetical protein
MPHAEASIIIRAPWMRVAQLYRDYRGWPRLFPATIRGVRLVRAEGDRTELEIDHRDGKVPNVLTEMSPQRVDLWETKRRYEGSFVNHFQAVPEGTRYSVTADIKLKGPAKLLAPLLGGHIRRQMIRYVLAPMRVAAETSQEPSPRGSLPPQRSP